MARGMSPCGSLTARFERTANEPD